MNTYVAMLRGINGSGQKIIKMDRLKSIFESVQAAGGDDVLPTVEACRSQQTMKKLHILLSFVTFSLIIAFGIWVRLEHSRGPAANGNLIVGESGCLC